MNIISKYFKKRAAKKEFKSAAMEATAIRAQAENRLLELRKNLEEIPQNLEKILIEKKQIEEADRTISLLKSEYKELFNSKLRV